MTFWEKYIAQPGVLDATAEELDYLESQGIHFGQANTTEEDA